MKILVTGGRDYYEDDTVFATLRAVHNLHGDNVTLIVGDAKGADLYARRAGFGFNWTMRIFAADWDAHGKAAGPTRNTQMIEEGQPQLCFAFPGGKGTADCVQKCHRAGIPVIQIDGSETTEELDEFLINGFAPYLERRPA